MKLGTSITLLLVLLFAAPAGAATSPNACRYSYDGLFRDMPVALNTAVTAPAEVVPGDAFMTEAGTASVELPSYLAQFGYFVGLLKEGRNDIPVNVWLAVSATNTKERVQVVGPIAVTATTTITVDHADDDRFLAATPFEYTTPVVPALTWTALGGEVAIGQDAGGHLPQLPVGNNGALRAVTGSAVIEAAFAGGTSIYLDCRPGRTTNITFDFAGPTYEPVAATPFATVAGPKNLTCIEAGTLTAARGLLRTANAPTEYLAGTPYTLPPVTLDTDVAYTSAAVTIAAANTTEGTQTVGPGVATMWTPTGNGPLRFTLAPPRSSAPYGSVQLTTAGGTLDCSPAAIRVPQPGQYAFDPNPDTPVFASAVRREEPAPEVTPVATPAPIAAPAPAATPAPRPVLKAPAGTIASTKLTSRGGRIELRLRCPAGSSSCRGKIAVVTAAKPKRSLAARASYAIAPGKQRTITLKLSAAGRSAVKRHRSVKVRVTLTTSAGVSATRTVALSQRRGS